MKKIIRALLLVMILFVASSITCLAAPAVDANGNVYDSALPAGFTSGYIWGDFNTFNSYASVNGLGGTYIWIEGTLSAVQTLQSGGHTIAYGTVTDLYGHKWIVALDSAAYTPVSAYSAVYNHTICIAGQYDGYSDVYKMPAMTCVKLYDFSNGINWKSTIAAAELTGIPGETVAPASTTNLKKVPLKSLAKLVAGRYYMTEDFSTYRPYVYVDVTYDTQGNVYYAETLATVNGSSKKAYLINVTDDNILKYKNIKAGEILLFQDNVLAIQRTTGAVHYFIKL